MNNMKRDISIHTYSIKDKRDGWFETDGQLKPTQSSSWEWSYVLQLQ